MFVRCGLVFSLLCALLFALGPSLPTAAQVPGDTGRLTALIGSGSSFRVLVADADGTNRVVINNENSRWPRWAPDGSHRLLYVNEPGLPTSYLRLAEVQSDNTAVIHDLGLTEATQGDWAPDGLSILFESTTGGGIFTATLTGTTVSNVTSLVAGNCAHHGTWSPDGQWIAYSDLCDRNIYRVPAAGGTPQPLTNDGNSRLPDYSPDGSKIVYRNHSGSPTIRVMSSDGGSGSVVLDAADLDGSFEGPATWSPSGDRILFDFETTAASQLGLWTVKPDGTDVVQLVQEPSGGAEVETSDWESLPVDNDVDGISDVVENGAPNGGDGNFDGIPDRDQPEVCSFRSQAPGSPYVTVAGPVGSTLVDVRPLLTPANPPTGLQFPLGAMAYELHGIPTGSTQTVDYRIPPGTEIDQVWQVSAGVWSRFDWDGETGAQIAGDIVHLTITDGGRGDLDGVANGVIVDPIATGSPAPSVGPTISVAPASIVEGDVGKPRTLQFAVTLSEPAANVVTVHYQLAEGSASIPGDVAPKSGTLTFKLKSNGLTSTAAYISAKVYPDDAVEGFEEFDVSLSDPTGGYVLGAASAVGGIFDDDPPGSPTISVGDLGIVEGNYARTSKATNSGKVRVTLSEPATSITTVKVTVAGGTATAGQDFAKGFTKVVTFKPGQYQKSIGIAVRPDVIAESDETVTITLSEPTGGFGLGRDTGSLLIIDDD